MEKLHLGRFIPGISPALLSPFLRSSHTQRVWLSMPTPCLKYVNTLPTLCKIIGILHDFSNPFILNDTGREVAFTIRANDGIHERVPASTNNREIRRLDGNSYKIPQDQSVRVNIEIF